MLSYACLNAPQVQLLYELVQWGVKVCEIEFLLPMIEPNAVREMFRRPEFSDRGRPPNGPTKSLASKRITQEEQRPYTALACQYQRMVIRGVPDREARVAAYRNFRRLADVAEAGAYLCPNTWFELCRQLDAGQFELRTCAACGEQELFERAKPLAGRCIWCGHSRVRAVRNASIVQARLAGVH